VQPLRASERPLRAFSPEKERAAVSLDALIRLSVRGQLGSGEAKRPAVPIAIARCRACRRWANAGIRITWIFSLLTEGGGGAVQKSRRLRPPIERESG